MANAKQQSNSDSAVIHIKTHCSSNARSNCSTVATAPGHCTRQRRSDFQFHPQRAKEPVCFFICGREKLAGGLVASRRITGTGVTVAYTDWRATQRVHDSRLPTDLTNPTRQREIKRVHRNRQPLVSPDAPSTIFRSTFGACDPPRAVTVPDRVIRPSVSRPPMVLPCSSCTLNPLCLSQSCH